MRDMLNYVYLVFPLLSAYMVENLDTKQMFEAGITSGLPTLFLRSDQIYQQCGLPFETLIGKMLIGQGQEEGYSG